MCLADSTSAWTLATLFAFLPTPIYNNNTHHWTLNQKNQFYSSKNWNPILYYVPECRNKPVWWYFELCLIFNDDNSPSTVASKLLTKLFTYQNNWLDKHKHLTCHYIATRFDTPVHIRNATTHRLVDTRRIVFDTRLCTRSHTNIHTSTHMYTHVHDSTHIKYHGTTTTTTTTTTTIGVTQSNH